MWNHVSVDESAHFEHVKVIHVYKLMHFAEAFILCDLKRQQQQFNKPKSCRDQQPYKQTVGSNKVQAAPRSEQNNVWQTFSSFPLGGWRTTENTFKHFKVTQFQKSQSNRESESTVNIVFQNEQ